MFSYCGNGITNDYRAKARTIIANLKDKNNPDLRVNIFEENMVPEELVRLEPKDLASSALKQEREKAEKKIIDARRSDWMAATSKVKEGIFACIKCKSKLTQYYEMQTRSADEPMTVFASCTECGAHWKF